MTLTQPTLFPAAFASGAGTYFGGKNTIPTTSAQPLASLADGFPSTTMLPITSGGVPPSGADFNGILNWITLHNQWLNSGGWYNFSASQATAIGGYQPGMVINLNGGGTTVTPTTVNVMTDPNSSMTNWTGGSALDGFMPAGVGAVQTSVQAKLRQTVSVLDFGADPTGTVDSGPAIRAALASFPTGAGTVFFPAGNYKLSSTVVLATNQGLVGAGTGATYLIAGTTSIWMIDTNQSATTNNNIRISDLSLINPNAYVGVNGIRLSKASFTAIDNIYSSGLAQFMGGNQASGYTHISRVNLYNCNNGIYLYACSNFVITNSTLSCVYASNTCYGVQIDSHCDGVELNSVNIQNFQYGVYMTNTAGGYNFPLSTIFENVQSAAPYGTGACGFYLHDGSGVQMSNCMGISSIAHGCFLAGTVAGVILSNCSFTNNNGYGLLISTTGGVVVTGGVAAGNSVSPTNTCSGIGITVNSANVNITGVYSGAYGVGSNTQKYGLELQSGCTNINISNMTYGANATANFIYASVASLPMSGLWAQTSAINLQNNNTETTLIGLGFGNLSLPANFFTVGKFLTVKIEGWLQTTSTPSLRFRAMLGANVAFDTGTGLALPAMASAMPIDLEFTLKCESVGASGAVRTSARIVLATGSTGTAMVYPNPSNALVFDTTQAYALDLRATWSAASPSNQLYVSSLYVTQLN